MPNEFAPHEKTKDGGAIESYERGRYQCSLPTRGIQVFIVPMNSGFRSTLASFLDVPILLYRNQRIKWRSLLLLKPFDDGFNLVICFISKQSSIVVWKQALELRSQFCLGRRSSAVVVGSCAVFTLMAWFFVDATRLEKL
jgi:hypothetical protein